jgi:putative pyruvate formate lyase activating enzyme
MGRVVAEDEFVRICLELQGRGAENINIVTGSHVVPVIVQGIKNARIKGLEIPLLWNSSAYESIETLDLLKDTVDVYLPDFKTLDAAIARRFFNASDYPENAEKAIIRMMELKKLRYEVSRKTKNVLQEEENFVLISGVMIRHLVLPDHLEATRNVLRWFAEKARGRALLSLMTQYTPVLVNGYIPPSIPKRLLDTREYETILEWLDTFDITEGFYQELVTDKEWLPDFERINPFSSELSVPVWHWKTGFVGNTA